jgi:transporter family-2 protein
MENFMQQLWIVLATLAGGCIALQAAANSSLRSALQDARYAAFFSIVGTMVTATVLMLALRPPLPAAAALKGTPWWNWIGGPLGAIFVLSGASLVPKLGAAAFIASVVAGQLAFSLFLDHFGLMHLPQQSITPGRLFGVLLVFAGVMAVKYL